MTDKELKEKLLATQTAQKHKLGARVPRNPEGPQAVARIKKLKARIKKLKAENAELKAQRLGGIHTHGSRPGGRPRNTRYPDHDSSLR